jgi:tripartite-type tricarboxylate transporter receptor subunit TctC
LGTKGRARLACALLALAAHFSCNVAAQPYPSKPVRIVVPFGPGGSGDITARTFGQYLEAQTRQPVIIENKPGANGIIGTETVKIAPGDGYTLLLTTNTTHAANVSLYRKVPYDPLKDFEHIGLFGTFGSVAVVPQGSAIQSIPDLVAFAKANPGRVFFGHYNSASQMSAELFKARAGIEMTAVSYKAIGNAVADLMGRQVQVLFLEYVSGSSHIEGGKVVALGVTGRERHKAWPNVPAIAEFYPGYELTAFLGLAAPARTPVEVVEALHDLLSRALADPGVTQSFDRLGMATRAMGRAEYRRYVAQEIERWKEHVRAAGIEPR